LEPQNKVLQVGKDVKLTEHDNLESLFGELQNFDTPALDMYATFSSFLDMKARKLGVPINGTFELTPFCNLDCKMCYIHLRKEQLGSRKLLNVEQWKKLMDEAIQAGMLSVTLTGGECLVHPDFEEIYLYLESKGIRITILTNGLLLTPERINFFKVHRPKGIQITLYGSSEDEYEAVTGSRCFETVMTNIRYLANSGISYFIAITPNRFLLDGGERLVRLAHELGLTYSINTSLFKPREDTGRQDTVVDLEVDDYIRLHLLRRKLNGVEFSANLECNLPMPAQVGRTQNGLLCSAGNSGFCLSWDGSMTPCSTFQGCEVFPLEIGFAEAWQKIRHYCLNYPLPAECGECPYNRLCPSCVMVHSQDAPPGHASPKVCERARKLVESGLVNIEILWQKKERE